ncbi:MAG: S8/S53 family peptidase [Candidatus Electryonea clarkiae]|nr:S8/S53 family peptidase [Candidatus Electryonea clarkiae]MDP8288445.1 S8/S53 family peptidase [Candidatus Electryonea clarkiae]
MKQIQKSGLKFVLITIFVLFSSTLFAANTVYQNGLEEVLISSPPDRLVSIVISFENPLDPDEVRSEIEDMDLKDRREYVISLLKSHLDQTASEVIEWIEAEVEAGRAEQPQPLWIAHAYWIHLRADRIPVLAEQSSVQQIIYDPPVHIDDCLDDVPVKEWEPLPLIRWNIEAIGAHVLWEQGYVGEGVIVGVIDTGCDLDHPDLINRIWVNEDEIPDNDIDDDENGYVDDTNGWNFRHDSNSVNDAEGHGSKAAGIVASDGSNRADTLGVAPGASVMVLRNWDQGWSSEATRSAANQYAADNGADVISCSMSYTHAPNAYNVIHRNSQVWLLVMGVIYANSQGNNGSFRDGEVFNINPPADCPPPWLHPDQRIRGGLSAMFSVGAVDRNGNIESLSTRGPAIWDYEGYPDIYRDYPYDPPDLMGLLKPDIVAPTEVYSTNRYGGYSVFGGESCATPHVAGCLALLRSIHPDATLPMLCEAIKMTAEDGGDRGHDLIYGAGRIRVDLAHEYLENWDDFGSLSVTVVAACEEGVVENAEVEVVDQGARGWTDENGVAFMERVMPGFHTLRGFKDGYETVPISWIEVVTGETTHVTIPVIGPAIHVYPCEIDTIVEADYSLEINFMALNRTDEEFSVDISLQYADGGEVDQEAFDINETVIVDSGGTQVAFELFGPQFELGETLDLELIWTRQDNEWEFVVPILVDVVESETTSDQILLPVQTSLFQPSPNPFNSSVKIEFALQNTEKISVGIYDLLGRRVAQLVNDKRIAGNHTLNWFADNYASGLYFVVLNTSKGQFVKKIALVK